MGLIEKGAVLCQADWQGLDQSRTSRREQKEYNNELRIKPPIFHLISNQNHVQSIERQMTSNKV